MRNKQQNIRILSSEDYSQSKKRMEFLQSLVIEGEEAKIVLKYAEKFLEDIERETLENLKKKNVDHEEVANYYRIAVRFVDMLRGVICLGEQKAETFERLKRNSAR